MSIEKIRQIKNTNVFRPLDLIIYLGLAILIIMLFWVFIFNVKKDPLTGVDVYLKKDIVYNYDFTKNKGKIAKGFEDNVIVTLREDRIEVKIINEGNDYNIFIIENKPKAKVYMYEADCFTKDCIKSFKPIFKEGDVIVCKSNAVKIVGLGQTGDIDIGVG